MPTYTGAPSPQYLDMLWQSAYQQKGLDAQKALNNQMNSTLQVSGYQPYGKLTLNHSAHYEPILPLSRYTQPTVRQPANTQSPPSAPQNKAQQMGMVGGIGGIYVMPGSTGGYYDENGVQLNA